MTNDTKCRKYMTGMCSFSGKLNKVAFDDESYRYTMKFLEEGIGLSSLSNSIIWREGRGQETTGGINLTWATNQTLPMGSISKKKFLFISYSILLIKNEWCSLSRFLLFKHRKNCECCHHHSLFTGHNVNVNIVVLNCQIWNQCLKCQVSGHRSLGLLFEGIL